MPRFLAVFFKELLNLLPEGGKIFSSMGKLYVVPTPIGNLKDITLRALEVLKKVDVIVCEDTRRTKILLEHYSIKGKRLFSYYAPKEREKLGKVLELLKDKEVALVSDAGTPLLSDPGYLLVREVISRGIEMEVLPGPTAIITALVGCGIRLDRFLFLGFLPKKGRKSLFEELKSIKDTTFVCFLNIKSLEKVLKELGEVFGENLEVCVARELTKVYEEYIRGSLGEVLKRKITKKGEVVLVFRPP